MAKQKIEKTDLLKRSIALLRSQGYHNTSMADIARMCDMSKAGLYHHFSSKLDLVTCALNWLQDDFAQQVLVHAYNTTLSPRQRFVNLLVATEEYLLHDQHGGSCVMANICLETSGNIVPFTGVIKAFFDNWLMAYQHLLALLFQEQDARALAESAIAQTQGALLLTQIYADDTHLKRVRYGLLQCWDKQAATTHQIDCVEDLS